MDIVIAIDTTFKITIEQLGFLQTLIVNCTNSYSLYECLIKLGTMKEKLLMIDIMALDQCQISGIVSCASKNNDEIHALG